MICLALTGKTLNANLQSLQKYRGMVDICELRSDFLVQWNDDDIRSFPEKAGIPVIFTLRRKEDGGLWDGTEADRQERILGVLSPTYAYVDLEKDSATQKIADQARRSGIGIIRSQHDFKGVPDDFTTKINCLAEAEDEIPKYAVMPGSTRDLRQVITAMKETSGKRIILGMGDWGFPTRILSSYYGCWFTFVSPAGTSAAPGHVDPELIRSVYRHHTITPATEVYGIIGNPIMHSRSPVIHNSGYTVHNLDAVYIPFQVDDLEQWFCLADEIPLKGFSVTIPHKENVISQIKNISPAVEAVGACNTVFRDSIDGTDWLGENTDIDGFIRPLKTCFSPDQFTSLRAAVIGAGGAARSAVYALKKLGVQVLVLNRTEEKAMQLAAEFGCKSGKLESESWPLLKEYSDLIVQTTSVGMHPHEDRNPLEGYPWTGKETAYDLIYIPESTRFLASASAAGCRVLNGIPMLLEQGRIQYRLFTGLDYPDV